MPTSRLAAVLVAMKASLPQPLAGFKTRQLWIITFLMGE
jgi:hypothetical protein